MQPSLVRDWIKLLGIGCYIGGGAYCMRSVANPVQPPWYIFKSPKLEHKRPGISVELLLITLSVFVLCCWLMSSLIVFISHLSCFIEKTSHATLENWSLKTFAPHRWVESVPLRFPLLACTSRSRSSRARSTTRTAGRPAFPTTSSAGRSSLKPRLLWCGTQWKHLLAPMAAYGVQWMTAHNDFQEWKH
jgi:hypothetical protein